MKPAIVWLLAAVAIGLAGCEQFIEQYNPEQPRTGARRFPTPLATPPEGLTAASEVLVALQVDDQPGSSDRLVVANQSDGAVFGLRLTVNHDYFYTMPVLQFGETVRVPDSYLIGRQGQAFPTERGIRIERVEVRHAGRLVGFFDRRGTAAPPAFLPASTQPADAAMP